MTQNTHTPGPWYYDADPDGTIWIVGDLDTWVPRIACVPPYSDMPNEANSRLIAAAPELFEALEQVLIEYDDVDLADHEPKSFTSAILSARAAIEKARGQS